jgi:hypothetical protein
LPARINLGALAAVSAFASKDKDRHALNGVCLEIEPRAVTYVATDGHKLIAHRETTTKPDPENDLIGAFTIPSEQCREHKFKKGEPAYAILFGSAERLTLEYMGLGLCFSPIGEEFPDWRRILPQMPLSLKLAQYDAVYLAAFSKFSETMKFGPHFFVGHNGEAPGLIRFFGAPDTVGVIMPHKATDESERPHPEWAEPKPFMRQAAE